jgi:hypothetical protein
MLNISISESKKRLIKYPKSKVVDNGKSESMVYVTCMEHVQKTCKGKLIKYCQVNTLDRTKDMYCRRCQLAACGLICEVVT